MANLTVSELAQVVRLSLDVLNFFEAVGFAPNRILELQKARGGSLTDADIETLIAEKEASRAARDAAIAAADQAAGESD